MNIDLETCILAFVIGIVFCIFMKPDFIEGGRRT